LGSSTSPKLTKEVVELLVAASENIKPLGEELKRNNDNASRL